MISLVPVESPVDEQIKVTGLTGCCLLTAFEEALLGNVQIVGVSFCRCRVTNMTSELFLCSRRHQFPLCDVQTLKLKIKGCQLRHTDIRPTRRKAACMCLYDWERMCSDQVLEGNFTPPLLLVQILGHWHPRDHLCGTTWIIFCSANIWLAWNLFLFSPAGKHLLVLILAATVISEWVKLALKVRHAVPLITALYGFL